MYYLFIFQDMDITGTNRTFISTELKQQVIRFINVAVRDSDLGIVGMDVYIQGCTFVNSSLEVNGGENKKLFIANSLFADTETIILENSKVTVEFSNFTTSLYQLNNGAKRYMVSMHRVKNVLFLHLNVDVFKTTETDVETHLIGFEMENITSVVIRDSVFKNIVSLKEQGSVFHMHSTDVHFEKCSFQNNRAQNGIIYATEGTSIQNSNCTFQQNTGQITRKFCISTFPSN